MKKNVQNLVSITGDRDAPYFNKAVRFRSRSLDHNDSTKILSINSQMRPLFSIGFPDRQFYGRTYYGRNYQRFPFSNLSNHIVGVLKSRGLNFRENLKCPDKYIEELSYVYILEKLNKMYILSSSGMRSSYHYHSRQQVSEFLDKFSNSQLETIFLYFLNQYKNILENWIKNKEFAIDSAWDNRSFGWGTLWKWNDLFSHFFQNMDFVTYRTRSHLRYIVGQGYIAQYDTTTMVTEPLVCIMVNKDHIPYIKGSIILNDLILSEYIELWVKDGFDVVRSEHKSLRPKYRKFIKKPLESAGVKIITKPSLNDIFSKYTLPKFNNLNHYNKFLEDSSIEVLDAICNEREIVTSF